MMNEDRRQRQFEARISFKEFSLPSDPERMRVDQLKPYMARVFNTHQSAFEEEAVRLVLQEAKKKAFDDQGGGILSKKGVVAATMKYGEYVRRYETIQTLVRASDWSKDGTLQREELRKLIENYEGNQTRSTNHVRSVLLFVTEQDLNFILQHADSNRDGDIDATEVMRAIGVWEELAAAKMHDFDNMNYKCFGTKGGCIIS